MKIRKLIYTLFVLSSISFISCDDYKGDVENIIPETKLLKTQIGNILLENHNTVSLLEYQNLQDNKAVAVVFADKTDNHPALAVMLKEFSEVFCDTLGLSCGTNTDITEFAGFKNTTAMLASGRSNLAKRLLSYHEFGQSDFLPSVAEMRLLCKAAPKINPIIEQLGGMPIKLSSNTWYWTSTEVAANTTVQAWLCSSVNGGILATPKNEVHQSRAILELNYPNH